MELALPAVLKLPLLAILGLIFGSFVTALSYRLPRGESVAKGRSHCGACGHSLAARDLVPVLSWLAQLGACRYCGVRVSWRYPAIELLTAALFVGAGLRFQDPQHLFLLLAMTPVMMALTVIDLEHQRLPNSLVLTLAVLAVGWRWSGDGDFPAALAIGAAALAVCLLLDAGSRRFTGKPGIGMGDAKLFALAGLALPLGPFLLFALAAGVLGVVFALWWRQRDRGPSTTLASGQFPFAPAILVSYWSALMAGEQVINVLRASA